MPPEAWTDDRLDELARRVGPLPEEVAKVSQAVEHLADELKSLREGSRQELTAIREASREDTNGVRTELSGLREEVSAFQRLAIQLAVGIIGTLVAGIIALIVALA